MKILQDLLPVQRFHAVRAGLEHIRVVAAAARLHQRALHDLLGRGAPVRDLDPVLALERRRAQLKIASVLATGAAMVGTVAFKLFGRSSYSARIGRTASVVSLVLGLVRAALKIGRFF